MVISHKDKVWETKVTVKCSYCGELIGGIGMGVKCRCGKTSLSGLLPKDFGVVLGGVDDGIF